jgi:dolichyl-phosphate beta-glucosyltransferase
MPSSTVIIPCYNEQARLRRTAVLDYLSRSPQQLILFVDDGSTDCTLEMLEGLQRELPAQIRVLRKERNAGKAEAVRAGLLSALSTKVQFVGYWDADLATPLEAINDLLNVLVSQPEVDIVLGSRVKLLGRSIERQPHRHYLGRAFATCASLVLDLPVYDTQCGAKLFRVTPDLEYVLSNPFLSRWIFDVELLARFLKLHAADRGRVRNMIYEFPLNRWRDVPGSKLRPKDFLRAVQELAAIRRRYRKSSFQKRSEAALAQSEQGSGRAEETTVHRVL